MQVADMQNKSTSASLGAGETLAVSMVEDAAFLMMLSSNLYSNQLLAAIREPLCNAWDANIEAGTTDQPLKISITTDGELIIQDNGLGIPPEKIAQIYGTYGASTKRNDSKTTGGFGLGSKAPWALVDAFRVTSEYNGTKTVYNMARSVVENQGKPGITPMVSVPTTRSGLTVSFRLTLDQAQTAHTYLKYLVMHGEMNAELSWMGGEFEPMAKLGMSQEPGSWNTDDEVWYNKYMGNHRIFVRYGAVIYPMLFTEATSKATGMLSEFMEIVGIQRLLVQAAPDTLALTPAREALSSQKLTEDGLTDLCVQLVANMEKDIIAQIPSSIAATCKRMREGKFSKGQPAIGSTANILEEIQPNVVKRYLGSNLGSSIRMKYWKELKEAEHVGFKKLYQFTNPEWLHANQALWDLRKATTYGNLRTREAIYAFLRKHTIKRIMRGIAGADFISVKSLRFSTQENTWWGRNVYSDGFMRRIPFSGTQIVTYLENQVVFLTSRLKGIAASKSAYTGYVQGTSNAAWALKVDPRAKAPEIAAVTAKLEKLGFTVVDLTPGVEWDPAYQEILEAKEKREKKAKIKAEKPGNNLGTVSAYLKNGNWVNKGEITSCKEPSQVNQNPKYFISIDDIHGGMLGSFIHLKDATPEDLFDGVVVRNGIERRMAENRGAIDVDAYFIPRVKQVVLSKAFAKYVTKERQKALATQHRISSQDIKLCTKLGIKLPGLEKLRYDPYFERILSLTPSTVAVYAYTPEEYEKLNADENWDPIQTIMRGRLEELPFIKKLKVLRKDPMLRALGHGDGSVLQWLIQYPERASALKTIVLSALKNGTKP